MNSIEARIARLLRESVHPDGNVALTPDTPLLEGGVELDSVEFLELVVPVEEAFGMTIDDEELSLGLFETIGSIARFVQQKCGALE